MNGKPSFLQKRNQAGFHSIHPCSPPFPDVPDRPNHFILSPVLIIFLLKFLSSISDYRTIRSSKHRRKEVNDHGRRTIQGFVIANGSLKNEKARMPNTPLKIKEDNNHGIKNSK